MVSSMLIIIQQTFKEDDRKMGKDILVIRPLYKIKTQIFQLHILNWTNEIMQWYAC
jgi:hypothetical protein